MAAMRNALGADMLREAFATPDAPDVLKPLIGSLH
jgi:hypothetical protein